MNEPFQHNLMAIHDYIIFLANIMS